MTPTARRPVGVVGVGSMGAPIVGHLTSADHPVTVLDRDAQAARTVASATGARVAGSSAELASECAVVLVLVSDDAAVLDVVAGPSGLLMGTRAGSAVLVCSSVSPNTMRVLGERAAAVDVGLLDAAMIGGIRGVQAGTITLLVGGDRGVLDAVRDDLRPWSAAVHHVGPLGAGQVAKSANNLIHWAQVCAIEEALRMVERSGLSVPAVRRALSDGPADSRALRELEAMKLTWWRKDLAGSQALATDVGTRHLMGDLCAELMLDIDVESLAALLTAGEDGGLTG